MGALDPSSSSREEAALADLDKSDDLRALESLIGRFNIFDALGIARVEIRHSNFLAFILDPAESHGQGQKFLKAVLGDLVKATPADLRPFSPIEVWEIDLRGVIVKREWEHIDLLISCEQPQFVVAIENKVDAEEHSDQLSRYRHEVTRHYPSHRRLFFYLTPESDEPSDDAWLPYSYDKLYRVLVEVRKGCAKGICDDFLVFLDHYLNLIGTRFMNDPTIVELCKRIYKNHRQALDLIHELAGSPASGVLAYVAKALERDGRWAFDARQSRVYFLPRSWLSWFPGLGQGANSPWWIHGYFHLSDDGKLKCGVDMTSMLYFEKRRVILTELFAAFPKLGFELPKSARKEVRNNLSVVMPKKSVIVWNEDDLPEEEVVEAAVKKELDDRYAWFEKVEPILKPLSLRVASGN